VSAVQPSRDFVLDNRVRADHRLVHDERLWPDAEQNARTIRVRESAVACVHSCGAARTCRRICMELLDRPSQQADEFVDTGDLRREGRWRARGCGFDPGRCRFVS
jgi:hypothetical protein